MPDLVLYMNSRADYGTAFHSMYWKVSPTSIHGILDTIRTSLVALVAEMGAAGTEEVPSPEVADQAVNVVVRGAKRSTIMVNTNQVAGAGTVAGRHRSSMPLTRGSRSSRHGYGGHGSSRWGWATVAGGVAAVAVWVGWSASQPPERPNICSTLWSPGRTREVGTLEICWPVDHLGEVGAVDG
jgi:hypothetical protein